MNNQEIFTPEERDENEERKRELIELIASGEAVLIVGAGSSARVGYVTWDGLLQELESLANQCGSGFQTSAGKRREKPLEYAEDIKSHIEKTDDIGKYYALLYELFQPNAQGHDEFHRLLVDFPFRGILTTNYDTVLEKALLGKKNEAEREGRQICPIDESPLVIGPDPPRLVHEFLLSRNNDPHIPQRIAHLHGLYRYRESIILSIDDYVKNYGLRVEGKREDKWTLHRKLLWAVLATRRVVFVGFSMEDPYFNKMLEIVIADLWGWNKSIHFAVMGISTDNIEDAKDSKDKAERLKGRYGVDTVFYEVFKDADQQDSHRNLEDLFAEIAGQCEGRNQSVEETQELSSDSERSEGEESKSISSGSRDILNWLKREGQRMIGRMSDED